MTRIRGKFQRLPPAPFVDASVVIDDLGSGTITLLADTGADGTTIFEPDAIQIIGQEHYDRLPFDETEDGLAGVGGITKAVRMKATVTLISTDYQFSIHRDVEISIADVIQDEEGNRRDPQPHSLLGRDILNAYRMVVSPRDRLFELGPPTLNMSSPR